MSKPGKTALELTGVWLTTVCCLIAVIWQVGLQARTTLHHLDHWSTTKTLLERGVIGGVAFRTTRPALHHDHLDLGAWHGFQEVLLQDPIDFRRVEFSFRLSEGAYVAVLIERGGDGETHGYSGLRLSREEHLPTAVFDSDPGGRFTSLQPVDAPAIGDSWNHVRITSSEDRLEFALNGDVIAVLPPLSPRERRIGFRGGEHSSLVDDVIITPRVGVPFHESFKYGGDPLRDILHAGSWVILLDVIAFALTWPLRRKRRALQGFALVIINVLALLMVSAYGLLDYYYLSSRYLASVEYYDYKNTIEDEDVIVQRLRARLKTEPVDPARRRILFVGSSQTWGAGAARREDVWVNQLENQLNADPSLPGPFECINTGISAATSGSLLVHFREWLNFVPELVVIDLSQNDTNPERFAENLERFTKLTRESGAKVVFVLEPNSTETPHPKLFLNHEAMRGVAARLDVPVVDMQGYFEAMPDPGFLWWDRVHLTSGGQELFAEGMQRALKPILNGLQLGAPRPVYR